MIGKLRRVPLRNVWPNEARDLTVWLEENIDVLGDELGCVLTNVQREQSAGDFRVDLVGEDENGDTVVIENQLERSNHDHLGKVLTYVAALDARMAVWIVADARAEHLNAINWLNESTDTPFYLVQLEGVRIDDSPPAPLLTKIVGPSEEVRAAGLTKKKLSQRDEEYRRFWTLLLGRANQRTKLHSNASPSHQDCARAGSGTGGVNWIYVLGLKAARVELYFNRPQAEENSALFDQLLARRDAVDAAFPWTIEWQRLDHAKACRIRYDPPCGGLEDEEDWPQIVETLVEAMVAFESALGPYVKQLRT